ncbi:DUF4097 domain-containing protein [Nonomuraea sp. MG754425]|uniref:DUF4097 family beta strand repeat-containing protein n=1 Tax=Nonomuraea sp. MG754425 TaxID=2570319 RepID=UPI001F16F971|nr:DUF4097 family beta strand repeat-containing protein [Nonomuraea sp. MG754425]MCF6469537.1 DUF4097 domain-containing protein [Nonomuraea sp. MG754425]
MKTIAVAGGLLASAILLSGCGIAGIAGPNSEESTSYQVTEKIAKLKLSSQAGDSVITETDGAAVRVVETLQWHGDEKSKPEHKVEGGTLVLTDTCSDGWMGCSVHYKIEVPKGTPVELDAGSGNLTLRDLTGDISVRIGSGDVDGAGLASRKVVADAGAGNMELKYATAPQDVELKAGSGDIDVVVPDGAYAVRTKVNSGEASVEVRNDAAAPNKISLTADSGNVTVKPA